MTADDRRAELAAAAVADDLTELERAELDRMIAADPSMIEEIEALRRIARSLADLGDDDTRVGLGEHTRTIEPRRSTARPLRAGRGRRIGRVLVAASAGLLVGVGVTLGAQTITAPDPVTGPPGTLGAFEAATFTSTDSSTQVTGGLVAHTWGTETVLDMKGFADSAVFDVVLLDRSGVVAPSGSFVGTGAKIDCRMNAALARANVSTIEIRTANGRTVASASVPPVS